MFVSPRLLCVSGDWFLVQIYIYTHRYNTDIKLGWSCGAVVVLAVEEKEGNAGGSRVPAEYYFSVWSIKAAGGSMSKKLIGLFQYHCASVTRKLIKSPEMRKGFTKRSIWWCHLKLRWCTEVVMVLWTFFYMRKRFSCFVSTSESCLC